jgi:hypothetical protein
MAEHDIDSVRAELQRLGYLTHGLERMLLQDALRSQTPVRAALRLALRTALLGAPLLALPLAFGLAAANGNLLQSPFDLAPLALHVLPPLLPLAALIFLALAAVDVLVARARRGRGSERLTGGLALVGSVGVNAAFAWQARALLGSAPAWQLALLGGVAALAAAALWRLLRSGLFALTVRVAEPRLSEAFAPRTLLALGVAAAALLVALPLLLLLRTTGTAEPPSNLPTAPGERVLLLGIDGVLPAELDYLLQHGDLPVFARLAREGMRAGYRRGAEPPAAFWTTVSTGLPSTAHGVAALDSFRPLGVRTPLARSGVLRRYWMDVERPLRLAEYRPVLSSRRTAYAFWELAARGGAPVAAVDWWGTYPAEAVPGVVVAHGAYQLLADRAAGAVAPEEARPGLEARRAAIAAGSPVHPEDEAIRAALPPADAEALIDKAFRADRFYLDAFSEAFATRGGAVTALPRAGAVYLPGIDIAAEGWQGGTVAFADLERAHLAAADARLGELLAGVGTVAVVLDPGRRGGGEGVVLLWRAGGCAPSAGAATSDRIAPGAIAAALLRALGLPQSAELPEPPSGCAWPEPPARVPTYGERFAPRAPGAEGDEYLKNLRSLGYL